VSQRIVVVGVGRMGSVIVRGLRGNLRDTPLAVVAPPSIAPRSCGRQV